MQLVFSHEFDVSSSESTYFAYTYPYPYREMLRLGDQLASSQNPFFFE